MNTRSFQLGLISSGLLLSSFVSAENMECSLTQPDGSFGLLTTTEGIAPEYCTNWTSGDAGQECVVNLGYDFGLKVEASPNGTISGGCDDQGSCVLDPSFNNSVVVSNSDGTFFDWQSFEYPLSAVVVKGGQNANVYTYDPAQYADTGLYAPMKNNGVGPRDISHISFCWNLSARGLCYQEETAWASGVRYQERGNWAMYVDFTACDEQDGIVDGQCQFDIVAGGGDGIGLDAGYGTITQQNGSATVSVYLENGFIFYFDLNDEEADENLKIEAYTNVPKGNPAVGRFGYKFTYSVGSSDAEVTVPSDAFYAIHMDVAYPVPCE